MILLLATAPFRSLSIIALTLAWARSSHVNAFSTSSIIHSYNNLNAANKAKGAIPHSSSSSNKINVIQRTTLHATTNPSSYQRGSLPSLPDIRAAVVVPGFLTGKNEFLSLSQSLNNMGIPTVVVPMPNWHWLPCLGGRSMRPMLERIDFTVRHLASVAGDLGDFERTTSEELEKSLDDAIPDISYNIFDCYQDFRNNPGGVLEVGGSAEVDEYPLWNPKGSFPSAPEPTGKVALIGHSAGGWICRAYLSERNYGGKSYGGNRFVHSLITLGSPHGNAPGPAFKGVEWVNSEIMDAGSGVRALAVGGTGYKGDSSGSLTEGAYSFCMGSDVRPDGSVYDGDGVTPVESALAMKEYVPHADTMILDDVGHFCWSDVFGGETVAPGECAIDDEDF
mmetsp:Transcript_21428/g.38377  ORF Transcript_21428/g.38377 Transcript_21428/m.38377 type:complete len:393 (-) Transcript_21428:163-1341(-)